MKVLGWAVLIALLANIFFVRELVGALIVFAGVFVMTAAVVAVVYGVGAAVESIARDLRRRLS